MILFGGYEDQGDKQDTDLSAQEASEPSRARKQK